MSLQSNGSSNSFFTQGPLERLDHALQGLVVPGCFFHARLVFFRLAHLVPFFPLMHFLSGLIEHVLNLFPSAFVGAVGVVLMQIELLPTPTLHRCFSYWIASLASFSFTYDAPGTRSAPSPTTQAFSTVLGESTHHARSPSRKRWRRFQPCIRPSTASRPRMHRLQPR